MAYKARREPDGFYSILGVPVFAEVPEGTKGAPFDIDSEWLSAALAKSKLREKDGYLAPLHFEHHDGGERSYKAGHYRLTRVVTLSIGGIRNAALLADFTKLPEHVFHAIMANEWPYRSVEIASYEEREIESVALLDDDTPFHKFKLLNKDTIEVEPGSAAPSTQSVLGPVAFAMNGSRHMALFRFDDDPKSGGEKMPITLPGAVRAAFESIDLGDVVTLSRTGDKFTWGGQTITFADDKDKDELPDDVEKLQAMLKAITGKLAKLQKGDGNDPQHTPAENDEDKDKDKDEKKEKVAKASAADDASILARFDRMESKLNAIENEKASGRRFDAAVKSLRSEGFHLSDPTLTHFRKKASEGQEQIDDSVTLYRATAKRDGAETLGNDEAETALVASFRNAGPEAHEKASEFNGRFDELVAAGQRNDTPTERKRFVEFSLRGAGIPVAS